MKLSREKCLELGKTYIEKHNTYPSSKKWSIKTAGCSRDRIYENWSSWVDFINELKLTCEVPNIVRFIPNTGLAAMADNRIVKVIEPKCKWDKDTIISKVQESAQIHGRPTSRDFTGTNQYPSLWSVRKHFGSFENAIIAAGLHVDKPIVIGRRLEDVVRELIQGIKIPKSKTESDAIELFIFGAKKAKWNSKTAKIYTDKFDYKVPNYKGAYTWLLAYNKLKYCSYCALVFPVENFYENQGFCKTCSRLNDKKYYERYARKRAKKLLACPSWVNINDLSKIYRECPIGYHVDHIVPLQGKNVCGLHVPWNLQYLPAKENIIKKNKHSSD